MTIGSSGNLSIGHAVTGPGGVALTVTGAGNSLTHTAGTISSTDTAINLRADVIDLAAGTVNSGAGNTCLLPNAGPAVSSIGGSAAFDLSATELNTVSAATIVVGEDSGAARTSGAMTVAENVTNLGTRNLLVSGADIQGGGALLTAGTLTLKAASGIGNIVQLITAASAIVFTNTTANAVSISNTKAGGLSLSGSNSSSGSAVTIVETSGLLTVNSSNLSTAGSGAVNLTANDMTITGTVTAGSGGAVNLTSYSIGTDITLGTGSTGLGLSSGELNNVIVAAAATLTIGDILHTGTMATDGIVALAGPAGTVVLQTRGSTITLDNAFARRATSPFPRQVRVPRPAA